MTNFSSLLDSFRRIDDFFEVEPGEDWGQGRTLYGGASLAVASHAARLSFPDLPPLRSVQASYAGAADGPLRIHSKMIRVGKSTFFVGVDLSGDAGVTLHAVFCYGRARASVLDYRDYQAPDAPAPELCGPLFPEAVSPPFKIQFDSRLAGANSVIGAAQTPELLAWVRHRDPNVKDGEAGFFALGDCLPPGAMAMFKERAPVSTMTWTINILNNDFSPMDWHLIQSRAEFIRDGYSSQSMRMWDRNGNPLASGSQQVALYY